MTGMVNGHRIRSEGIRRSHKIALLLLVFLTVTACQPERGVKHAVPNRDINTVMDAHVNELMAVPGVTGVAVGELDDGTPCILVLVVEESAEMDRRIPKTLEGHPVRIMVSGEIKPMDSD